MSNKNFKKLLRCCFRILIGRPIKIVVRPLRVLIGEILLFKKDIMALKFLFLKKTELPLTKKMDKKKIETHRNILQYVEKGVSPKISFVSPMRYGNNDEEHSPDIFFNSLIKNTSNLDDIEVIIAIDADDDLSHFVRLKEKYVDRLKNIKIYVSEVNYGYRNLHLYDKFLYQYLSPSSRMIVDFSDDCKIVMPNWDKHVLEIDASISDNIYFIHTNDFNLEKYVGSIGNDLVKLVWCLQAISPSSYFPIVSRKALEIATNCLNLLSEEEKAIWAPFANSTFFDCYIDIISHLVQGKISECRVFYSDLIHICAQSSTSDKRRNVIKFDEGMALCYPKFGLSPNDMGFITLLKPETQKHIIAISENIAKEINAHAIPKKIIAL